MTICVIAKTLIAIYLFIFLGKKLNKEKEISYKTELTVNFNSII